MRHSILLLIAMAFSSLLSSQNCPSGFSYIGEYEGHYYYLSNAGTNPSNAYAYVQGQDFYLASITSSGENLWLASNVTSYVLIGLNDLDVEGTFVWQSGEPVGYTNWWPGEPNNSGNEDYTVINFRAFGRWNDIPNWVSPLYIIESEDSDCDGVSNFCDVCPGGDDSVDANGDGLPDCAYYPGYENLSPDWICKPDKVLICHRPPGNRGNSRTLCIGKEDVMDHLGHGDFAGPCTGCDQAIEQSNHKGYNSANLDTEKLSVYPNPASGEFNIRIPESAFTTEISIYDIQGRMIWRNHLDANSARTITVNSSDIGPGIFTVLISSEQEIQTERIFIQQ